MSDEKRADDTGRDALSRRGDGAPVPREEQASNHATDSRTDHSAEHARDDVPVHTRDDAIGTASHEARSPRHRVPQHDILNIDEAAELLGVSIKTFNKVLHRESMPARKIG